MGLPAGLSSCRKGQDNSGVAAEETSGLHQRQELAFVECRPRNPGQKTVGCFGGHGMLKVSQQLESLRRSRVKAGTEIPLEMERAATAVARASQGLRRGTGLPF